MQISSRKIFIKNIHHFKVTFWKSIYCCQFDCCLEMLMLQDQGQLPCQSSDYQCTLCPCTIPTTSPQCLQTATVSGQLLSLLVTTSCLAFQLLCQLPPICFFPRRNAVKTLGSHHASILWYPNSSRLGYPYCSEF